MIASGWIRRNSRYFYERMIPILLTVKCRVGWGLGSRPNTDADGRQGGPFPVGKMGVLARETGRTRYIVFEQMV